MNPDIPTIIDIAYGMMYTAVMLSMPVLATSLVVGVIISLFQTVTSVQEMTITFVPKLIAVMTITLMTLPWTINMVTEYTQNLWAMMAVP